MNFNNSVNLHSHQLYSFLVLAESRSFSAAAEKLFISHTALIQQINTLENTLGFQLFHRSSRGVTLTESGRLFYEGFRQLMKEADDIITRCQDLNNRGSHIRVANINDLHTFYFYADFYRRFQQENPQITIDFVPAPNDSILSMCRNGEIDVGFYFGTEKQADNRELIFRTAAIPNMSIVVSKNNPLASHESVCAEDLQGRRVYAANVSESDLIYRQVSAISVGKLELFDATMQSIFEICDKGDFFILPIWFRQQFPTLCFLPFDPPVPFTYQVVCRKEHSPAVQKLVNSYLEYDSQL